MNTTLNVAYGPQIAAAANRHNLDPQLLAAVAAQETGGPGADSGRNIVGDGGHGRGVFQIDDRWHDFARTPAAMDPGANADYAAGMLESNLNRYGGDVRAALSAYNAGSPTATGTTTDWGDGRPVGYADSVLRHYDQLGGGDAVAADNGGSATATAWPSERDAFDGVDDLRSFASSQYADTYGDATGSPSFGDSDTGAVSTFALNLPAYRPLPQLDQRDRDVAPAILLGDDDDEGGAGAVGFGDGF